MRLHPLILTLGAGALVAALPATAAAAPMIPGEGRMVQGLIEHFLNDPEVREQAQITDEQVDQIEQITRQTRRAVLEQQGEAALARLDLEELWRADEPDAQAIHSAIDRLAQIQTQTRHALADARLQAAAVLTPDQRETLRTLGRERVREHISERRGDRGPGRGFLRDRIGRGGPGGPEGPGALRGPAPERGPAGPGGPAALAAPADDDFLAFAEDFGSMDDLFLFAETQERDPLATSAP